MNIEGQNFGTVACIDSIRKSVEEEKSRRGKVWKRKVVEEESGGRVEDQYRKATHKTTDTDHADFLTRSGAVPDERDQDGEADTKHVGSIIGLETFRDGKDGLLVGNDAG
jgi:hypothetical protein